MDIGTTPKYVKVRQVWLVAMPGLKGCGVWECRSGQALQNAGHVLDGLAPERSRQLCLQQHCSNAFSKSPVPPSSNSILLGSGANSALMHNSLLEEQRIPLLAHVLTTLVIAEDTDLLASLTLHQGLVREEGRVGLILCP